MSKPQGVAPHPISFFLKKKETKKITFADRSHLQIHSHFLSAKDGIPKG
jgi:hypothetical protein